VRGRSEEAEPEQGAKRPPNPNLQWRGVWGGKGALAGFQKNSSFSNYFPFFETFSPQNQMSEAITCHNGKNPPHCQRGVFRERGKTEFKKNFLLRFPPNGQNELSFN